MVRGTFCLLSAWLVALAAAGPGSAGDAPAASSTPQAPVSVRAYVPGGAGESVSVIDTASNTVIATIPAGGGVEGIALNPGGTRVYATSRTGRHVLVIDTATNAVVAVVPMGSETAEPTGIAVSPDGARVYVADPGDGVIAIIDAATNQVVETVPLNALLLGAAIDPRGKQIYLSTGGGGDIIVVETAANAAVAMVSVGGPSHGLAVSPGGEHLYAALDSGHLAVIETQTNALIAMIAVGASPRGVAVTPDGTRVYVANSGSDSVSVLDATAHVVIDTVAVGSRPGGVSLTPDGTRVYVVNAGSNDVSVIEAATSSVIAVVPVGIGPAALGVFVGAIPLLGPETSPGETAPAGATAGGQSTAPATAAGSGGSTSGGTPVAGGPTVSRAGGGATSPGSRMRSLGGNPAAPNSTITGTVVRSDTEAPLAGVVVDIISASGATPFVAGFVADENGIYTTSVLSPGIYKVRARKAEFAATHASRARFFNDGAIITVTAAAASIADVFMPPGAGLTHGISGLVTNASNVGQAGVTIDLYDANNNFIDSVTTGDGELRPLGEYSLQRRMAAGFFKVRARRSGFATTFNASADTSAQRHTFGTARVVRVVPGADATVNFKLEAGSNISGTVTDGANPIAGAIVDVLEAGTLNTIETGFTTNAAGFYTFGSRLPAGSFIVRIRQTGFGMIFHDGAPTFSTAGAIDLAAPPALEASKTVNATLAAGGVGITGTIRGPGDVPIPGASVDLFDGATNLSLGLTFRADGSGAYSIPAILAPTRSYKLRARAPGLIDTFYHEGGAAGLDAISASPISLFPASGNDITLAAGGTIRGRITDGGSGLPGVPVLVFRFFASTYSSSAAVSDADGNYAVTNLHPGEYRVRAEVGGFATTYALDPTPFLGQSLRSDREVSRPVIVSGSDTTAGIDIVMAPSTAEISGLIRRGGPTGAAVPPGTTAQVRSAYPTIGGAAKLGRQAFVTSVSTSSFNLCGPQTAPLASRCNYVVTGLAYPDHYAVEAFGTTFDTDTATGWSFPPDPAALGNDSRSTAQSVELLSASSTATVSFSIPDFPGGGARTISGTVRDENGVPIRFAQIVAIDAANTGGHRAAQTNGDGSYTLNHLSPGRYWVRVDTETDHVASFHALDGALQLYGEPTNVAATLVDVTGGNATGIDIKMPGLPASISGIVTEGCAAPPCPPIRGAGVSLRNFFDNGVAGATTRSDGSYEIRGLAPGWYKLRAGAYSEGPSDFVTKFHSATGAAGRTFEDGSFIEVSAGQVRSGMDFALSSGATFISGTVRKDSSTGPPVVGALVEARSALNGSRVTVVLTMNDGAYRIPGLSPGKYKVAIFSIQPGFANQWYPDALTREQGEEIEVTSAGRTGIDFVAHTNAAGAHEGSLSGRIFDLQGAPLDGAGVFVLDRTGGFVRRGGVTGRNGDFSARGLPPGEYVAYAQALGRALSFFGGVPHLAAAAPITVVAGEDFPGVNITLPKTSVIEGTIAYAGAQTGAVRVGLFADQALTDMRYSATYPRAGEALTFPLHYEFANPAPDTLGVLLGEYYVAAFIDSNPNGVRDAIEASGASPVKVVIADEAPVPRPRRDFTLFDGTTSAGTTTAASCPQAFPCPETRFVPRGGEPSKIVQFADIKITENGSGGGALTATGRIHLTLPAGLTFAEMPRVSTISEYGLKIWQGGAAGPCLGGPNAPARELGNRRFAFSICAPSSGGAAVILVSTLRVAVPGGFISEIDPPTPIAVDVGATTANGLTPSAPAAAIFIVPTVPTLSGLTDAGGTPLSAIGEGVEDRTVVLTGANFSGLAFDNPGEDACEAEGCDTIDFGPGITVISVTVDSDNQLTVRIRVAANAVALRGDAPTRAIIITDRNADGQAGIDRTTTLSPGLTVNLPPVITAAGTQEDGTGALLSPLTGDVSPGQTLIIKGSNFQSPPNLEVTIDDDRISVNKSTIASGPTQITVKVDVAKSAELPRTVRVTVTNPDGGKTTSSPVLAVALAGPDRPEGGGASATSGTTTPPPTPKINSVSPASARTGVFVTVTGEKFSTTAAANAVTFAGPNNTRVPATLNPAVPARANSLSVKVPDAAVDGPVKIAVSGIQSVTSFNFAVTNPRLSGLTQTSALQGDVATVDLTGAKLAAGAAVSVSGAGLGIGQVATVGGAGTQLRVPITIGPTAAIGFRDVTVTNPDGASSTLAQAFEVRLRSASELTLSLKTLPGDPIVLSTYLPAVADVRVTLDATGRCTARTVTPTMILVEARFAVPPAALPPTLTFTATSSALPGTATNEDCEPDPSGPTKDWSLGPVGLDPVVTSQQVTVQGTNGVYQAVLASWDWGGSVRIDVTDIPGAPTVAASLALPLDHDRDALPAVYENDAALNANQQGVNVLNGASGDQNGNGVPDGADKFTLDGLTNFDKYRGVYLVAPVNGSANAPMLSHTRLGAGMRHLFTRGRGFRNDPVIRNAPGTCGINLAGAPVAQDPQFLARFPCPVFSVGDAFRSIGVKVWDVTDSFSAATVFPTKSLATPTKPMLGLATVTYDAVNCSGGAQCDHTSKTGVRQWVFPTLGFSTYGTSKGPGDARVFAKAMKGYFTDRPYRHQENLAGAYVPTPANGVPMLAPITVVCDRGSGMADNGAAQPGECTVNGTLGGDVYVPGAFNEQLSAMDSNTDGCVELPFVPDPTTLPTCDPAAPSAVYPQATFQQVTQSIVTHELGHALGVNLHTTDATCVMYQYSINWIRDGRFSPTAASLVQVVNKGGP